MGARKRSVIDVYVTEAGIKQLKKGYVLYKTVKGLNLCLRPKAKDRKIVRQIDRYKKKIKELSIKLKEKK